MTGDFIKIESDGLNWGTHTFEGPLDLLLYLIQQDEIDIYDIPIAQITRQYLAYLEAMKVLDLEIAGEFILMAATLIRIKAQMLLPAKSDEKQEYEDPRSSLVQALIEYRQFKMAAEELKQSGETWQRRHPRGKQYGGIIPQINYQLEPVDINALMLAFGNLLRESRIVGDHLVEADEVSIDDRIGKIIDLLESKVKLEFSELFEDDPRRIVMAVTFMALLELARLGQLLLRQTSPFGKIWVERGSLNRKKALEIYANAV